LVVTMCFVLVSGVRLGEVLLFRTAVSTSVGLLVATLLAAGLVHRTASAVVAPATLVRVLTAMAGAITAAHFLPAGSRLVTLAECAVVVACYVGLLALLREIGGRDLATLRQVLGDKA
jgi:hypothetical protein